MFSGTRHNGFVVTVSLAAMLAFVGCSLQHETEKIVDQQLDSQRQAVSLYVDAMMLNELNDNDKAIQKLDAAIGLDPRFALAYSLKGDIYQANEEYAKSADAYEVATELDPWSFKDFFSLGKVAQIMNQFARSIRAYVTACELEPQHYEAHINVAKCYYQVDDFQKAMEYGTIAKGLNPDAADADLLFGDVFEAQEEHDKAIIAYRRALELEGNKPKVMVPLAVAYLRTNRLEAGKELLLSAIEIEPNHAMAHQYLGFAYLRLKAVDDAIASYQRAVQIDPVDWMARKGLGVAYMLKAEVAKDETFTAKGLAQWQRSLEIRPGQPELREMYARYTDK